MSTNKFPDPHDHWALYQWWEPVIVSHAVRCRDFKEAKQQAFVVLAEAAARYNGTGPFVNFFSLSLMGLRAETRARAQQPTLSLEALAEMYIARDDAQMEAEGNDWELLPEDDGPSLDVDDPLFEMQNFLTGYTVDFDELPGDGDLSNPEPLYIIPPTMEEMPGEPYAITQEDEWDADEAALWDDTDLHQPSWMENGDDTGAEIEFEEGRYLVSGLVNIKPKTTVNDRLCSLVWGTQEDPPLPFEEDDDLGDVIPRPTSRQVQHDLELFLSRLDPYQRAFVKATLNGSGPQACKKAALAAIKQAQLNRRKANVHRNAIAALARDDLHAACQQWSFMPQNPVLTQEQVHAAAQREITNLPWNQLEIA